MTFGRGLIETTRSERQRLFTTALEEITSLPAEPQQLRSVRELRKVVEEELARLTSPG